MTTTPHQNRDIYNRLETVKIDDGRIGEADLSVVCSTLPAKYAVRFKDPKSGKVTIEYILCCRVSRLQNSVRGYPQNKDMRYL